MPGTGVETISVSLLNRDNENPTQRGDAQMQRRIRI